MAGPASKATYEAEADNGESAFNVVVANFLQAPDIKLDWVYITTAVNASLAGDKITIEAFDTPGNVTEKQTKL